MEIQIKLPYKRASKLANFRMLICTNKYSEKNYIVQIKIS